MYIRYSIAVIILAVTFVLSDRCIESASAQSTPTPAASQPVWTAEQILAERRLEIKDKRRPRFCRGGAFRPCVCPRDVTKLVQYRPAVRECNNNAAIILSGRYLTAYSAVVRDWENKDRWPVEGINGCSAFERDTLGLNKCSAFKVQDVVNVEDEAADAEIHCLGASGYSALFRRVSRITIKLRDVPGSNTDPLERLCLAGGNRPLN
jgi:hypothetical protein